MTRWLYRLVGSTALRAGKIETISAMYAEAGCDSLRMRRHEDDRGAKARLAYWTNRLNAFPTAQLANLQPAADGALISYELPVQSDHRVGGTGGSFRLPSTGSPGARSSGGCGLARPVVPGRVSLLAVPVSTPSSVVTSAARIATIIAIAKSTTEVRWLFHALLRRGLHSFRDVIRLG